MAVGEVTQTGSDSDHVRRHSLAPHLGRVDEPLARMLTDATGYPVVAANDARKIFENLRPTPADA